MTNLYSYLPKDRPGLVRDLAACCGFVPGRPVRLLDAAVLMVVIASVGVLVRLAGDPSDHSRAADAIAQRFSGPAGVANAQARLTFVPDEAMLWSSIPPQVQSVPAVVAMLDAESGNRRQALDPLSVIILRDLPEASVLSSGMRVSPTSWAVAAGDLDKLVVTLGRSSDRAIVANLEMISPAGYPDAAALIEIKRGETARGADEPIVAIKASPRNAAPDNISERQPRRVKAVHKRRAGRRPLAVHRAVRDAKPDVKRVKTPPIEKGAPVAGTASAQPPSGGPAADVFNGIGKIISNFGLVTAVPPSAPSLVPKAP